MYGICIFVCAVFVYKSFRLTKITFIELSDWFFELSSIKVIVQSREPAYNDNMPGFPLFNYTAISTKVVLPKA